MDTLWISELVFLYLQCFYISSMQVEGLVTTIRYPEQNTLNISCWNTSQIQIQNIDIQEEETICRQKPCVLNSQDTQTIDNYCDGEHSCLVDYNYTTSCLLEFRYVNLSYTCKHENGTSLSTFEEDFGDWKVDSSVDHVNSEWKRNNQEPDHTRKDLAQSGYSINAFSWSGRPGTIRMATDKEFTEPICLSLWYQFYANTFDCFFNIYKITDRNQTLLSTVDGNFTIFKTWINISVNVHGQEPFKLALEANFTQRHSTAVRAILIDDTSIAYRPCEGQQVHSACHELNKPIEIECEKQYLVSDIELSLEPEDPTSHLKNCPAESIKNEINSFCRNLNKTEKCKFIVLNFTNGYEDCYVSSKNISVSFQCNHNFLATTREVMSTEPSSMFEDTSQTTSLVERSTESSTHFGDLPKGERHLESPVQYDIIAIAAGVGGGVLLIIIVVVVIYRVRRLKTSQQDTSPGDANKAYDENQYDYASQQHLTSSESSNQNTNKQNNSNLNTQKQVLIGQDGQQSADLYSLTDDGTYDVSSNNKPRENQNDNNLYSHTSGDGTYDVSSNSKHRENPNDNNVYSHTSGDGTYDVSSNNKKNQMDDNIYSQKADDVYDSAGHHKLPDRSEETYDHFFGQQTEDEYDTTTRT